MTTVHLGFDMGIRNLAYCLLRHTTTTSWSIMAWNNIDLLEGGTSSQDAKKCCACKSPAKYISIMDSKKWCKGCATGIRRRKDATEKPTLPTLPCGLSVKPIKELAVTKGVEGAKKWKKEDCITWAHSQYLVPWKCAKTMDASMTTILTAMDTWLDSVLPTFASATLIRLENQPVMKGPTMKSVQMILFTLLSHRLAREHAWTGRIEFVHAGVKSKGTVIPVMPLAVDVSGNTIPNTVAEGAAYRARKKTAESDVIDILTKHAVTDWLAFFNARSKKSDLADAFLMALRN